MVYSGSILLFNGKILENQKLYIVKRRDRLIPVPFEYIKWSDTIAYNIGQNLFREKTKYDLDTELCYFLGCLSVATIIGPSVDVNMCRNINRLIKILDRLMIKHVIFHRVLFKLGVWVQYFSTELGALSHQVPEQILNGPRENALAFLDGFKDCAYRDWINTPDSMQMVFICETKKLAQQIHILWSNLGKDVIILDETKIGILSKVHDLELKLMPIKKII